MTQRTIEELVQRLDRVERENGWLKRVGTFLVAGIGALVIMGQVGSPKRSQTIEAEQFIVKDTNGTKRAEMTAGYLALYDAKANKGSVF